MPINRKAMIRYQVYDRCLRNPGREYNMQELLDEVNKVLEEYGSRGIGRTQFYKDITYLETSEWQAPVERYKKGTTVYFRYEDRNYSISNQPLNQEEVEKLKSALLVLGRFKGMPQFEWVSEIIAVLEGKMGMIGYQKEAISFDNNLDYAGLQHIEALFNAIVHQKVVKIVYQPFSDGHERMEVISHPYHLRQYNQRWFVLGLNQEKNIPTWNMALDRIISVEDTQLPYTETDTDWDEHFSNVIGVTRHEGEPEEIRLRFTAKQAPFVITKPLHETMKPYRQEDGSLEVTIQVIPNFELEKVLLAFGEKVEVLAPLSLRERLIERIRQNYEQYLGKMKVS